MLKDILPLKLYENLNCLNGAKINEIRIRCGCPVVIMADGKRGYLSDGLTQNKNLGIVATRENIEEIILKASRYSLYASNEQLKQGFMAVSGGIRLGICGEVVYEKNSIKTVKNITSINLRVANQIFGFSDFALKYIFDKRILSVLILSPPACGKTTLLRDLARRLSMFDNFYNVVIIDERCEIASVLNGRALLDVGNSDVLSGVLKTDGITMATRVLAPDVIICDEIKEAAEFDAVTYAATCGVSIIASMHAANIEEFLNKKYLDKNKLLFDRYIILSNKSGIGTFESVYDKNFNILYERVNK